MKDDLAIELGDANASFAYKIVSAELPAPSQNLTLVMCQNCSYMMGQYGMNIGGLSALFNAILVDFSSGRVGFKAKLPDAI